MVVSRDVRRWICHVRSSIGGDSVTHMSHAHMASFRKITSLCGWAVGRMRGRGLGINQPEKAESDKITMTSEQRVGGGEAAHWHLGGDNAWRCPMTMLTKQAMGPAFTFHGRPATAGRKMQSSCSSKYSSSRCRKLQVVYSMTPSVRVMGPPTHKR